MAGVRDQGSVSVVIPNYNCARWLPQVISGCFAQGGLLKEVIVSDDASTDDSLSVLETLQAEYGERLKVVRNPDKGGNNARNFGFGHTTGDFIQWLDADDFILPGKFEAQLRGFDGLPGTDVVYSDWYKDVHDPETGTAERRGHEKAAYADFTKEILSDNWSVPANYLYRRETAERLDELKAWNPARRVAQDREYVTIAALTGARFAYVPGYFSVYNRWNANSVSSMDFGTRLDHQLDLEETFRAQIRKADLPARLKKRYEAILNAHILNACYYYPALTIRRPFWIGNVDFGIIHWKKYPFLPFIYVRQLGKYAMSRRSP